MFRAVLLFAAILLLTGQGPHSDRPHSFHGVKRTPKVNHDSLFVASVPIQDSEEGRRLLETCMAAYGGREKIEELRTVRLTYDMESILGGHTLEVVKTLGRDRRYTIHRKGDDKEESRILNGDQSWFQNADTLMVIDSGRFRAELFSYLTLALPRSLETESFEGLRYGTRADDPLGYLFLNKLDSLLMVVGIEPESGLIRSSTGVVRQGTGSFVFENRFSDHRTVEGYVFPHALTNISLGLEVARSTLTAVTINPDLSESEFMPSP